MRYFSNQENKDASIERSQVSTSQCAPLKRYEALAMPASYNRGVPATTACLFESQLPLVGGMVEISLFISQTLYFILFVQYSNL